MTEASVPQPAPPPAQEPSMRDAANPFQPAIPAWLRRVDQWADRSTDRLNPILVKEARQALKSKQFLATFALLLVAGLVWSLLGIAILGYEVGYYAPGGRFMLVGYFWIMTFPLVVVVPFAAFRSLAGEKEDGTYELLSITTLRPRQIIVGKMCSSLLQIMVYLSALAPCIAFTYLLRGVDVLFLIVLVGYTALVSVLLCQLGLLLATQVTNRQWQVIFSLIFILGLALAFLFPSIIVSAELIERGETFPYDDWTFWAGNAMLLTAAAAIFSLMFLAATASITAWSENRSTPLRIANLVVHAVFIAWCGLFWAWFHDDETLICYAMCAAIYWWIVGAMMVGERSQMSSRVRRSLPRTTIGRAFTGWFYPGSAAGYLFVCANLLTVVFVSMILAVLQQQIAGNRSLEFDHFVHFLIVAALTIIAYLGVVRVIVRLMRRKTDGPIFGLVVSAVLVFAGTAVPFVLEISVWGPRGGGGLLQITNPFITWMNALLGRMPIEGTLLMAVIAAGIFFVNLITAGADISLMRIAAPQRVLEEEESKRPEPLPQRTSPWD